MGEDCLSFCNSKGADNGSADEEEVVVVEVCACLTSSECFCTGIGWMEISGDIGEEEGEGEGEGEDDADKPEGEGDKEEVENELEGDGDVLESGCRIKEESSSDVGTNGRADMERLEEVGCECDCEDEVEEEDDDDDES